MPVTITAVIITQNEERNIGRCLQSLQGVADEIVVVDSGSTDATESICREAGARFEHHGWEGFAEQKNYANSLATGDWILSIDADEALSEELRKSIIKIKEEEAEREGARGAAEGLTAVSGFKLQVSGGHKAYSINRLTNYCGHWIRHCGWYPDWCCRLWRKGDAIWEGIVHEELRFVGEVRHERITGDLHHYSYYNVAEHASRLAKYAKLGAEKYHEKGKRCGAMSIMLRPAWTFIRNYFLKGGMLDGWAGFVVCRMEAMYTMTKYAELYRLSHKES